MKIWIVSSLGCGNYSSWKLFKVFKGGNYSQKYGIPGHRPLSTTLSGFCLVRPVAAACRRHVPPLLFFDKNSFYISLRLLDLDSGVKYWKAASCYLLISWGQRDKKQYQDLDTYYISNHIMFGVSHPIGKQRCCLILYRVILPNGLGFWFLDFPEIKFKPSKFLVTLQTPYIFLKALTTWTALQILVIHPYSWVTPRTTDAWWLNP